MGKVLIGIVLSNKMYKERVRTDLPNVIKGFKETSESDIALFGTVPEEQYRTQLQGSFREVAEDITSEQEPITPEKLKPYVDWIYPLGVSPF